MGGQTSHIPQHVPEQNDAIHQKVQVLNDHNIQERQPSFNKQYRFQRKNSLIIRELQKFKQDQQKRYTCIKRLALISQKIYKYDESFQKDNNFQNDPLNTTMAYLQSQMFPLIQMHQQTCFECTGRYWQIQQWENLLDQVKVEQQINNFKQFQFSISNPNKTDSLQVIVYKYLKAGDGYIKNDKVRNMKIYKFPLSQLQLTNLIFQHQYLVIECQNSYWSFEKDTKRLIVQSSVLLSDVRDKCLGVNRSKQAGFKWFGLRQKWHPEVMYESDQLKVENIKDVRVYAQHLQQIQLNYNVFKANCKVYVQYIMKNCVTQQSWGSIQTFFDFFHK